MDARAHVYLHAIKRAPLGQNHICLFHCREIGRWLSNAGKAYSAGYPRSAGDIVRHPGALRGSFSGRQLFPDLYNLQGDVIALLDASNGIVVEYKYDLCPIMAACAKRYGQEASVERLPCRIGLPGKRIGVRGKPKNREHDL